MNVKWKVLPPRSPAAPAVLGTADVSIKKDTGSSYRLIMAIPVLIRVLWLMFDKDSDGLKTISARLPSCFLCDAFDKPSFFSKNSEQPTPPGIFTILDHDFSVFPPRCKLFSIFLPLRIVSTLKETTLIAKPCRKSSDSRVHNKSPDVVVNMGCFFCAGNSSQAPFHADPFHPSRHSNEALRLNEGDQVVPSSLRWTAFRGQNREVKPLPPPPDPEELMSDEAADSEVEFFTSDQRRLLPRSSPKAMSSSGMNRDSGQVNPAYQESSLEPAGARVGLMAFSWPGREEGPPIRGPNIWGLEREENLDTLCGKDQHQPSRPRLFSAGPAPPRSSVTWCPDDKPQVPPRIPIPPKPAALSKAVGANEDDKPPKIPPRVPLVPPCPPRTLSPRSLPIYINGVMPATQSFAANPNYVSKALQRQHSERAPPTAQCPPCIVPILKDGRQASNTHYILLPPGRPACSDTRGRHLSEPTRTENSSLWQNR